MSLIRAGEDCDWEDVGTMYVYPTGHGHLRGTNLDTREFSELAMRALAQSNEFDSDELERIHGALRDRFDLDGGADE